VSDAAYIGEGQIGLQGNYCCWSYGELVSTFSGKSEPLEVEPVCHRCNCIRTLASGEEDTNLNLRQVPAELARQVKSQAALKGQTIREYVLDALRKAIPAKGKGE